MNELSWSDGTKPDKSNKKDKEFYLKDNNNEINISTEKNDSITKRELANDKLNEREMIKQVSDNPFLMNNNYIDVIITQQEFLTPQNSNY
jgi:hypothetical protein|tara:strand:+ start:236 stop:505 length:270 start_codon:yes stop_codon:yes gene_type:complete